MKATVSVQDNYYRLLNHDSHVSVDFTIRPWWLRRVNWLVPGTRKCVDGNYVRISGDTRQTYRTYELVSERGYLLVEDVVGLMAGVADGLAERAQHGVPIGGERL